MAVFRRYIFIQVPGWFVAALVLLGLHLWLGLPTWAAIVLLAADIAKDFALYPFLRHAYETGEKTGIERLIGAPATAAQSLAPEGYVQVHGELWHAELPPGHAPVAEGARLRVQSAHGMTLIVAIDKTGHA
jgi:membrane protein implicated in regulation of membrane protease activity